jgi:hypothetical protein
MLLTLLVPLSRQARDLYPCTVPKLDATPTTCRFALQ